MFFYLASELYHHKPFILNRRSVIPYSDQLTQSEWFFEKEIELIFRVCTEKVERWKRLKVKSEKWKGRNMRYISLYIFYRIGMYTYVEPKTNFVKFIAELLLSFSYTQTWLDSSIHYNTGLIFAPSSCQQFIPYWQLSLVVRRCPPSVYFCRDIAFL